VTGAVVVYADTGWKAGMRFSVQGVRRPKTLCHFAEGHEAEGHDAEPTSSTMWI
jgi:hypothetical protein